MQRRVTAFSSQFSFGSSFSATSVTRATWRKRLAISLFAGVMAVFMGGCVYKVPIKQGNQIDQTKVDQLRFGMSRSQVLFLMGNPIIDDPLHVNRWDYVYYLRPRKGNTELRRVTLFFNPFNGELERVVQEPDFGTKADRPSANRPVPSQFSTTLGGK